nr:MAG TPA: N-acetylmuramoyl-L-alanine amidase [Caudoviricetes sp.]
MTYSKYVKENYQLCSPSSEFRNHIIDTVTIHCYVGQASADAMANWLCNPEAEASANYGIACDGTIVGILPEERRSWCSSSPSNDHRAITIECASDSYDPYRINPDVYNALIKLLVDICERYPAIGKLRWRADPTITDRAVQNMTAHRWFAPKACPGDYLYTRFGNIANEVNRIIDSKNKRPYKDGEKCKTLKRMIIYKDYTSRDPIVISDVPESTRYKYNLTKDGNVQIKAGIKVKIREQIVVRSGCTYVKIAIGWILAEYNGVKFLK